MQPRRRSVELPELPYRTKNRPTSTFSVLAQPIANWKPWSAPENSLEPEPTANRQTVIVRRMQKWQRCELTEQGHRVLNRRTDTSFSGPPAPGRRKTVDHRGMARSTVEPAPMDFQFAGRAPGSRCHTPGRTYSCQP